MSEMEWLKIFGDNLAYLLAKNGMSQIDLAERAGLTQATISRYISARQLPGVRAIINIAHVLGLSIDELIDFGDMIE